MKKLGTVSGKWHAEDLKIWLINQSVAKIIPVPLQIRETLENTVTMSLLILA
jgi:hypothetical protein